MDNLVKIAVLNTYLNRILASQANISYVDKLTSPILVVDRMCIKTRVMGITCAPSGRLIPIFSGMGISYPPPMGITF